MLNDYILRPNFNLAFVSATNTELPSLQNSFEERKAAYFAARDRIFSMDLGDVNEPVQRKPRNNPAVAHRMIAHALGHRINPRHQAVTLGDCTELSRRTDALDIQCRDNTEPKRPLGTSHKTNSLLGQNVKSCEVKIKDKRSCGSQVSKRNMPQKQADKVSSYVGASENGSNEDGVNKDYLKREHLGAAKRMFAHALGLHTGKDGFVSKCSELKQVNKD